jgi:dethiobiotin synthetase
VDGYQQLAAQADVVLVEGEGGWRVPLGPDGGVAELASTLGLPVILVVGLRLGCINHALLSAAAIRASGLQLAGWVANRIDPDMAEIEGNIATLEQHIQAPCLGKIPYLEKVTGDAIASGLSIPR